MAKVAILVPHREMCDLARRMVGQYANLTALCVEYVGMEDIPRRARELEAGGCELIVARGAHAHLVRDTVRLPLVELRTSAQELGRIVLGIRRELGEDCPRIGLISFANAICDTRYFNELFQIDLRLYPVSDNGEQAPAVEQARREGCLAVVGGNTVCDRARQLGLPCVFMSTGEEGLRSTLETANRVGYAIDLEKRNSAEMDTMLSYTFNGIMQVDSKGVIRRVNHAGYQLLGQAPGNLLGRPVTRVLPGLSQAVLEDALVQGKASSAFVLDVGEKVAVVNIAPVSVDQETEGAILTFQEGKNITRMDNELRYELYQRGFVARYSFDKLVCLSRETEAAVRQARRMAKYAAPVLLTGEPGTGKEIVAQCIHNDSLCRGNAFVTLDCSAYLPETLDNMLFGNYTTRKDTPASMAELAENGTLFVKNVEELSVETQYKLFNLIRGKFLHNGSNRPIAANVRVIASSCINLSSQIEKGSFRSDLYYALSVLGLELLPLRRRREDILGWFDFYLGEWQARYKRYVQLTAGARQFVREYDWPGNLSQVNGVCERVVLLTERRSIDEVFLRRQVEQIMPHTLSGTEQVVLFKDQKGVEIAQLLKKHNGSREKVAAELGVSKTTLWRYMKKYGIGPDYTY